MYAKPRNPIWEPEASMVSFEESIDLYAAVSSLGTMSQGEMSWLVSAGRQARREHTSSRIVPSTSGARAHPKRKARSGRTPFRGWHRRIDARFLLQGQRMKLRLELASLRREQSPG